MTLIYTPDRHLALVLVARDEICAIDSIMRSSEDTELSTELFAALVALENAGYVERRTPSSTASRQWRVQLTVAGTQLLSWFDHRHDRPVLRQQPVLLLRSGTR